MNTIKRIPLILIIAFSLINFSVAAQKNKAEKKDINLKIEYANNMIWHFNYNVEALRIYQEELKLWFENPNKNVDNLPKFYFISFNDNTVKFNFDYSKNNIFDYNFQLDRINKEILQFSLNCKKLEGLTSPNSDKFRQDVFTILKEVQEQSIEIAEFSYDFSRACAINYKNEDYPIQLKKLKNVVSQSKNLILALRNNNSAQVKDYLRLLDEAMFTLKSDFNIMKLYILSKTTLSIAELKFLKQNIYENALSMSAWGEQYVQSSFSPKGVNNLLQKTIQEFNEAERKMGCASAFNSILNNSEHLFMLYTEEPNTLYAEKIEKFYEPAIPESTPAIAVSVKEDKETQELLVIVSKEEETIISSETSIAKEIVKETVKEEVIINPVEIKEESFNEKDINSLAGALPNNIIILMDVSASMKKSGKLPVLKKSITHILDVMRKDDILSLIAYSGEAEVLISGAKKANQLEIEEILTTLKSSGGADLKNALDSAYQIGKNNFTKNGNNKLIIASDGVFGVTFSIIKLVQEKSLSNFELSVFQYNNGEETNNTKSLKYLSEIGNGAFRTITNNDEAVKAMMLEIKKESK